MRQHHQRGLTWGGRSKGRTLLGGAALTAAIVATGIPAAASASSATPAGPESPFIVRERPGSGRAPELLVEALGGEIGRHIGIVDAFEATMPTGAVAALEASAGVHSVTPNAPVQLSGYDGYNPVADLGSTLWAAQEVTGAGEYWNDGIRGQGVDVALLDSGVVPVNGLNTAGKVVYGPDLSFESQSEELRDLDTFGHGTHMAGLIAGRDDATPARVQKGEDDSFTGIAPNARIVSVKLADAGGATDVSQVLAGIDWVVQHRNTDGLNIKVLNLSFGTNVTQDYRFDPLTYATEVAWRHGIVVVVAGGNEGDGSTALNNPAYDPFVLAVGAADGRGTYSVDDDVVASFSSRGDDTRRPDLVAPGTSLVSLRAPGSSADVHHPEGHVGTRLIRGSGTSQAAAIVSGAAALLVQQRPRITPDQVKALLKRTAQRLPAADVRAQGSGMIDLKRARDAATPSLLASTQAFVPATGTGSLELARGSEHLADGGVDLVGERDIFGAAFVAPAWAAASAAGTAWTDGDWNGNRWTGNRWTGNRWTGDVWTGNRWTGNRWTSDDWSGNRWTGNRWTSETWLGNRWTGNRWTGDTWSSSTWR